MPNQRFHGFKQRCGLHDHALAATKRPVIHRAVTILGKLAQVLHVDLYQAAFLRPAHDAVVQRPREKLGENGDEVESLAKTSVTSHRKSTHSNIHLNRSYRNNATI